MFRSLVALFVCSAGAAAGPFQHDEVQPSEILTWAATVTDFQPTASGSELDDAMHALGPADGALVSLGELDETMLAQQTAPGSITLSMAYPMMDGEGWDFAIFENAGQFFDEPFLFAELAYVEVSSNGVDFVRFPNTSLNVEPESGTPDTELNAEFGRDFAGINITNVQNLAGIHPQGVGTGFDLSDLVEVSAGVEIDLNAIAFVRLVDIPGEGSFVDSEGRAILDTWVTAGPTGGFDLDAVGARYPVPEPSLQGWRLLLVFLAIGWMRRR